MTKEETAYAATLNLLGSDVLDPVEDCDLADTLGRERRRAIHSTGPCVDCPRKDCYWTTPYGGQDDNEHFADLWEHLIAVHKYDVRNAEDPAQRAWNRPVLEGAVAA
jgi:hypothetical protein